MLTPSLTPLSPGRGVGGEVGGRGANIFIAIHYLELGGVERSLLALLNILPRDKYTIDLFIYQHSGELMQQIPSHVHLLPEIKDYSVIEKPLTGVLFSKYWKIGLARLKAKVKHGRFTKNNKPVNDGSIFQYVINEIIPFLPSLNNSKIYDLAISYLTPHNIVLEKVAARKKIAWIHTDYSVVNINKLLEFPVWNGYDSVVSISDAVSQSFLSIFPELQRKIINIENFLDVEFIRKSANEFSVREEMPYREEEINLCSVGRYCNAKNFENAVWICKYLRESGLNVVWYVIGYGGDEDLIKSTIKAAGMESRFILLGKKSNPYPFIQACDIYIQPSRFEGKAITVQEAQILYKPVVITRYPTSASQIVDGIDGIIVSMDNREAAKEIADFIKNEELQKKIIANLKNKVYNEEQLKTFNSLFG